ncbi:MAG TPA: hypothetical protein VH349_05485 [Ktedonobacterales bacterium]|jgi:hypothetical protein
MPTDPFSDRTAAKRRASKKLEQQALTPDEFVRALRAIAGELERDPNLAKRVTEAMRAETPAPVNEPAVSGSEPTTKKPARPFRPRVIEGARPDLGPGVPDPFALRARLGETGLAATLDELRIGSLRAIVREYKLDPTGKALTGTDAERLRKLILRATDLHGQ